MSAPAASASRPGPLATSVLLAGSPFMALMFAALGPILPLLAAQFGGARGGAFAAQMIMTVPAIGVIAGGLVAGILVDRFGARRVLVTALGAYALAGSSGLYLGSLAPLLVARLILGLAVAHVSTAIGVLVGGWFEGLARARFLGFQAGVAGVASLTFLLLSGALAERVGWRAPFALYLLAAPVLALAVLRLPESTRRIEPSLGGMRELRELWRIYAVALCLFAGYFMTSIQLSFLLAADHVDSPLQRSMVIAGGVFAGGVAGASFGPILGRLGPRLTPCLVSGLLGGGLLLIGVSSGLAITALGAVVAGGGGGMIAPYIESLILARAPLAIRARAVSFTFTVLYVADFLNPLIVAPLRLALGIHNSFVVVGGVLLIAAAAPLFVSRARSIEAVDAPLGTT